jgi:hypothetical protein
VSNGTFFYKRTAYTRGTTPVPDCFLRLDRHFGAKGLTGSSGFTHPVVGLAENLCRRMADVDFHAETIKSILADTIDGTSQAPVIGTILVAHFGACKSVLDAAAVALNEVFSLGQQGGNCDLRKIGFWNGLKGKGSSTAARYEEFVPLIASVVEWRDAAVHRVAPLTIGSRPIGSRRNVGPVPVVLFLEPGIALRDLWRDSPPPLSGHPLHFHRLWRHKLVDLCDAVCTDIATAIEQS